MSEEYRTWRRNRTAAASVDTCLLIRHRSRPGGRLWVRGAHRLRDLAIPRLADKQIGGPETDRRFRVDGIRYLEGLGFSVWMPEQHEPQH